MDITENKHLQDAFRNVRCKKTCAKTPTRAQAVFGDFEYKPLCIIQNGVCYLKQNRLKDYRHSSSCRLRKGDENLFNFITYDAVDLAQRK